MRFWRFTTYLPRSFGGSTQLQPVTWPIVYYPIVACFSYEKRFTKVFRLGKFYYRFIPLAAKIQAPLYALASTVCKKDGPLLWTPDSCKVFAEYKKALAGVVSLAHLRVDMQFRLSTDVSCTVIGAILKQFIDDVWQPLGFISRKLFTAQTCYNFYYRELFVTNQAVKHFL